MAVGPVGQVTLTADPAWKPQPKFQLGCSPGLDCFFAGGLLLKQATTLRPVRMTSTIWSGLFISSMQSERLLVWRSGLLLQAVSGGQSRFGWSHKTDYEGCSWLSRGSFQCAEAACWACRKIPDSDDDDDDVCVCALQYSLSCNSKAFCCEMQVSAWAGHSRNSTANPQFSMTGPHRPNSQKTYDSHI